MAVALDDPGLETRPQGIALVKDVSECEGMVRESIKRGTGEMEYWSIELNRYRIIKR